MCLAAAQLKRFLPLAVLLAAVMLIFALGGHRYLSFATIQDHGEDLQRLVDRHWLLGLLLLTLAFALLTASVTPGVFFMTVLAGYLYGPWVGGVATSAAATLGALAVYFVGRSAAQDWLRSRAEAHGGFLAEFLDRIDKDTFLYVLGARLVVSVPFHLINVAAGVMRAPLRPYLLATFVGVMPAHILYCWIGHNLGELPPDVDPRDLVGEFVLPLAGVGVLAIVLPLAIRAWRRRRGPASA